MKYSFIHNEFAVHVDDRGEISLVIEGEQYADWIALEYKQLVQIEQQIREAFGTQAEREREEALRGA